MKKSIFAICLTLLFAAGAGQLSAQTSTTTSPLVVSHDMGIMIPTDRPMMYEYEIDTKNLSFTGPEQRQKFFEALNDDVATYRYDKKADKLTLVLNREYIERNKWQTADVNKYLAGRSAYMKEKYGTYEHPVENNK